MDWKQQSASYRFRQQRYRGFRHPKGAGSSSRRPASHPEREQMP